MTFTIEQSAHYGRRVFVVRGIDGRDYGVFAFRADAETRLARLMAV